MKKWLLLLAFIIPSGMVSAQDVEEVQMTLLTERTATWCPFCGQYGWTLFRYLLEDNSEKAIIVSAHYGGSELETPTSGAFSGNFSGGGQPKFYVNNDVQTVNAGNVDDARFSIMSQVNDYYEQAPSAAFGLDISENGGTFTLDGKVRFLETMEGEFYLGVYVVEKSVIHFQASQGENAEHEQVLTTALTDGIFAESLTSGTVAADTDFDFSFDMSDVSDPDNIEIVAILWRKEDTGYFTYINGIKKDLSTGPTTSVDEPEANSTFGQIRVLGIGQEAVAEISNVQKRSVRVDLTDLQGRIIHSIYTGDMPAGTYRFAFPQIPGGIYLIRAVWDDNYVAAAQWFNQ